MSIDWLTHYILFMDKIIGLRYGGGPGRFR
jgi:hypothetical protein